MNKIQLACAGLIGSAFVLTGLLLVNMQDRFSSTADAGLVLSKDNFTIMTAKTRVNEEALFIIENNSQKLMVYKTDITKKVISPAAQPYDLATAFGNQPATGGAAGGGGRMGR